VAPAVGGPLGGVQDGAIETAWGWGARASAHGRALGGQARETCAVALRGSPTGGCDDGRARSLANHVAVRHGTRTGVGPVMRVATSLFGGGVVIIDGAPTLLGRAFVASLLACASQGRPVGAAADASGGTGDSRGGCSGSSWADARAESGASGAEVDGSESVMCGGGQILFPLIDVVSSSNGMGICGVTFDIVDDAGYSESGPVESGCAFGALDGCQCAVSLSDGACSSPGLPCPFRVELPSSGPSKGPAVSVKVSAPGYSRVVLRDVSAGYLGDCGMINDPPSNLTARLSPLSVDGGNDSLLTSDAGPDAAVDSARTD